MSGGEVENLRNLLARADLSAPSIQGAAAAMMKLYDRSSTLAVNEWRNQLQSCSTSQYIPLLYVANEVLQTSKRNRGTKFLEAFSPVLGPTLQFLCDRQPSLLDKVRRTVKIWGDRQVFSVRYVADLLHRLDVVNKPTTNPDGPATAVPLAKSEKAAVSTSPKDDSVGGDRGMALTKQEIEDEDEDEESSPFHSGPSLLNVDNLVIDKDTVLKATEKSKSAVVATFGMKRRRAQEAAQLAKSTLTGSSHQSMNKKHKVGGNRSQDLFLMDSNKASLTPPNLARRRSVLSTHNIIELLSHMADLNREYSLIQNSMTSLVHMNLLPRNGDEMADLDDIVEVGDELVQINALAHSAIQSIQRDKKLLFSIADQKKVADGEVQKYLPFFKNSLKLDDQDIRLCENLEQKLKLLQLVHADAKKERDAKRQEEARRKTLMEEAARRKQEDDERARALQHLAMPKPGQVWNPLAREYQDPTDATHEDWRN